MELALTDFGAALDYLFARTTGGFRFGLERTTALLAALGDPHRRYPVIHIAGTNGKGSSVATAYALLRAKGLRVGRYTSPHLVDFRERMLVNDAPIAPERVVEFVERRTALVEQIGASFFEATTALAFLDFAEREVDVAVVETGLGGRLDSTNVVDPIVAGVTSIGFDHTEYLGDTLEAIALEKAGIFKPARPAVIGERDPSVRSVLAAAARQRGATPVRVVGEESAVTNVRLERSGTTFTVRGPRGDESYWTPLAGEHQAYNTAFTLALLDVAGERFSPAPDEAREALAAVRLPGRFDRVGKYVFDVAHNPAGAAVLARTLAGAPVPRPIVALTCVLGDKDWREMVRTLAPVVDAFVFTNAPTAPPSRSWHLGEVELFARDLGVAFRLAPDFDVALAGAAEEGETVLVTGSFHTVGDAMSRLQVSPLPG